MEHVLHPNHCVNDDEQMQKETLISITSLSQNLSPSKDHMNHFPSSMPSCVSLDDDDCDDSSHSQRQSESEMDNKENHFHTPRQTRTNTIPPYDDNSYVIKIPNDDDDQSYIVDHDTAAADDNEEEPGYTNTDTSLGNDDIELGMSPRNRTMIPTTDSNLHRTNSNTKRSRSLSLDSTPITPTDSCNFIGRVSSSNTFTDTASSHKYTGYHSDNSSTIISRSGYAASVSEVDNAYSYSEEYSASASASVSLNAANNKNNPHRTQQFLTTTRSALSTKIFHNTNNSSNIQNAYYNNNDTISVTNAQSLNSDPTTTASKRQFTSNSFSRRLRRQSRMEYRKAQRDEIAAEFRKILGWSPNHRHSKKQQEQHHTQKRKTSSQQQLNNPKPSSTSIIHNTKETRISKYQLSNTLPWIYIRKSHPRDPDEEDISTIHDEFKVVDYHKNAPIPINIDVSPISNNLTHDDEHEDYDNDYIFDPTTNTIPHSPTMSHDIQNHNFDKQSHRCHKKEYIYVALLVISITTLVTLLIIVFTKK